MDENDTGSDDLSIENAMLELVVDEPVKKTEEEAAIDIVKAEQPETVAERMERIKIDGEDQDVPISKLVERYQKESAADKRMAEAAKIRKDAEAVISTRENDRRQLADAARYFQEQAQSLLPPQPDPDLLNTDPVKYLKQEREYKDRLIVIAQARTAQTHLQELQKQESDLRELQSLQTAKENLIKEIPAWADEAKANVEHMRVAEHMRKLGNDDQRIANVKNYGDVVAYRESMLYRELLAKAKETSKQLTKLPTKVERPGSGERSGNDAMQRFNKSGSFNDALEALNRGLLG